MAAWLTSLSLFEQIFACIALPATVLLVLQTVMLIFGLGHGDADADMSGADGGVDHDFDHDFGHDFGHDAGHDFGAGTGHADEGVFGENNGGEYAHDTHDSGLRIFSVRGITAFFAVMGWSVVAIGEGLAPAVNLLVSFAAGLAMMFLVALAMMWFSRLQSDGTRHIQNALGSAGRVYIRIPAKRNGTGKVNITLQGAYCELEAVTDEENDLPFGADVTVVGISGGDTLVVRRK